MRRLVLGMFQLILLATLTACGGGGSDTFITQPTTITPTPAAAFTSAELVGKTVYEATPNNYFGVYGALVFNSGGTVTKYQNLSSTSLTSASAVINGTYSIDSNGVLTVTLSGLVAEKYWKVTSSIDSYGAYDIKTSFNTSLTGKCFYNQLNGASQALAYATGNVIPAPAAIISGFTTADFSGKLFYSVNSSGAYQQKIFWPDGTISMSTNVTSGTPSVAYLVGTWQVTSGTLSIIMTSSGQITTYSYLNDINSLSLKYRRTQTASGSLVGFCYDLDPTKSLAQAMALSTYVLMGGSI